MKLPFGEKEFWDRALPIPEAGCMIWMGASRNGYGIVDRNGKTYSAHRLAWEYANKRIVPENMKILHSCDTALCIQPHHLFLGTQQDNMHDMMLKGRRHYKSKYGVPRRLNGKMNPEYDHRRKQDRKN